MLDGGRKNSNSSKQEHPQKGISNMGMDRIGMGGSHSGLVISTAGPDNRNIFHYVEQHALPIKRCVKSVCFPPFPATSQSRS